MIQEIDRLKESASIALNKGFDNHKAKYERCDECNKKLNEKELGMLRKWLMEMLNNCNHAATLLAEKRNES